MRQEDLQMNTAWYHVLQHANAEFAVKIIFDYVKPASLC